MRNNNKMIMHSSPLHLMQNRFLGTRSDFPNKLTSPTDVLLLPDRPLTFSTYMSTVFLCFKA